MIKSHLINDTSVVSIDTDNISNMEQRYSSIVTSLKKKFPIALTVEVSSKCNLKCTYCGLHSHTLNCSDGSQPKISHKNTGIMELANFKTIINKCTSHEKLKVMYFSGHGEPLLNVELPAMIKYAKQADIAEKIVVITNGVLLTTDLARRLDEAELDEIRVSYDIFNSELYKLDKGADFSETVRGNLEKCLELIEAAIIKTNVNIECKYWVNDNSNLNSETEIIVSYFKEKLIPGFAKIRISNLFDWSNSVDYMNRPYNRTTPCEHPFYMPFIHTDGDVSACCLDTSKSLLIGNMFEVETLQDVLSGQELLALRTKLLNQHFSQHDMCRSCNKSSCVDGLLQANKEQIAGILNSNG